MLLDAMRDNRTPKTFSLEALECFWWAIVLLFAVCAIPAA